MRVLVCTHHPYAGLGVFAEPVAAAADELVEWVPGQASPPAFDGFDALIALGGRARLGDDAAHPWLAAEKDVVRTALDGATPVLGVCLGAQVLLTVAGGTVRRAHTPEIGWHQIRLTPEAADDPVLGALPNRFPAFEWHHDECRLPPDGAELARSEGCVQAFRLGDRPAWGVQFHPEATHQDLGTWLDYWHTDRGAVATGLDPEAIRRETAQRIEHSNELGRMIIQRFLGHVAKPQAVGRPLDLAYGDPA